MPNTFTPLVTTAFSAADSSPFVLKVLPQAEAKPAFEPLAAGRCQEQTAKKCTTPSVTLQRQGDAVSGIRIECGCGQVIELACVF
jgi:hypothetical protein